MASIFRQPLLSIASKLLHSSSKIVSKTTPSIVSAPQIATRGLTLSRNYSCISSFGVRRSPVSHRVNTYCGCRSYFTKGDEELMKFLEQEIADEKKIEDLPTSDFDGWQTTKQGTNVKLTKKFNDETITVEFDVNASVMQEDPGFDDVQEGASLVSKPPFEVEILKASGKKLQFLCEFQPLTPSYDEQDAVETQEDDIEDQFSIEAVSVLMDGDEKYEDAYRCSSTEMDQAMYDFMMDLLDERGLDDDFINNLVDFCTAYEHGQYVDFLEKLKKTISDK